MAKLTDTHIYGTLISDGLITANANINVGKYLNLNTSNELGIPNINIGKQGNNFMGIGSKDTTSIHTIRYGASNGNTWLPVNNEYNHEFDGNIKANLILEQGSRVWTAKTFDPNSKINTNNGNAKGNFTVEQDLNIGQDLFVSRNLSVNGKSTFMNDIVVQNVNFSSKLGKNENAVSASKLLNAVSINSVPFDGTKNIQITAPADGGNSATTDKLKHSLTINNQSFDGSSDVIIKIDDSSKLPITGGTLTGSLNINGNLTCTGEVTAYAETLPSLSDRRLKENICKLDNAMDIINKINVYNFNFKNNPSKRYGVIAQELKYILPDSVSETPRIINNEKALGVNYQDIFSILVRAVQEQDKRIKELEKEINKKQGY